jgi:hypothetical protein
LTNAAREVHDHGSFGFLEHTLGTPELYRALKL